MTTDRRTAGLALLLATVVSGCGYPKVSPKTYDLATALYGICNREQAEKLDVAAKLIEDAQKNGEISDREAGWLNEIIQTARDGDWDSAESEARKLMRDQVRRGENLGPPHRHDDASKTA